LQLTVRCASTAQHLISSGTPTLIKKTYASSLALGPSLRLFYPVLYNFSNSAPLIIYGNPLLIFVWTSFTSEVIDFFRHVDSEFGKVNPSENRLFSCLLFIWNLNNSRAAKMRVSRVSDTFSRWV
jgi:hypothetical protein